MTHKAQKDHLEPHNDLDVPLQPPLHSFRENDDSIDGLSYQHGNHNLEFDDKVEAHHDHYPAHPQDKADSTAFIEHKSHSADSSSSLPPITNDVTWVRNISKVIKGRNHVGTVPATPSSSSSASPVGRKKYHSLKDKPTIYLKNEYTYLIFVLYNVYYFVK